MPTLPLVLIPMLTVTEMKNWSPGESYPVLALLGNQGDVDDDVIVPDYRQLFAERSQCTDEEKMKKACNHLNKFVKSVAKSLHDREDIGRVAHSISRIDPIPKTELAARKETKARFRERSVVTVPRFNSDKFNRSVAAENMFDRSITDPYLLALKAAVNWSKYHGEKLLPGCHKDESVCECCAAADEYCARHRPPITVSLKQEANNLSDLED